MTTQPNILFLMCDQLQGRVFEPGTPCLTPNLDRLAQRGIRFQRAYTPNAVCSPARASLMTGLLPHNHGVLYVTHTVDDDQSSLRTQYPHWAQHLAEAGYRTGYFGKWHVERSNRLEDFGWQVNGAAGTPLQQQKQNDIQREAAPTQFSLSHNLDDVEGYRSQIFYGVVNTPPEQRGLGINTALAADFLRESLAQNNQPWCCFVSLQEPHDPFITGEDAFNQYDVDSLPLPASLHDDLTGRPNIYRKAGQAWHNLSERQHREATACYYASITEIDTAFGRLIDQVDAAGQLENTIIILTSDHGELLGAHGLYCKNFHAGEEVYNIPLIMAGPGIAADAVTTARAGLQDLGQTLLSLCDLPPLENIDGQSLAAVLEDPAAHEADYQSGFAEYFGGRYILTQRVLWDGNWKLVFNGFDFDELYNLAEDPHEMHNLINDPTHRETLRHLMAQLWRTIRDSGDHSVYNSHYPILRIAPFGPALADEIG